MRRWRFAGLLGVGQAVWFSIAYLWPPETPFYRVAGITMGFAAISSFIMAGAERICEAIKESNK